MIGFLFLTYDNVFNERVWIEYFRNVDPKKFRIFVHPKNISLLKKQCLFKNFILPKTCKTSWGDFSLIKAQNLLMKTALKNLQITHVILVSHNSLPTTSFNYLYDYLKNRGSIMGYGVSTQESHLNRYNNIVDPIFPKNKFYMQDQWSILCRADAKILVNEYKIIKYIFRWMTVPDEHVYINYLIHYKNKTIQNKRVIYIEWENGSPKILNHISNDFMKYIKNTGCLFIRKVEDNAILDVKHLLS